jgi:hypothetical protein
MEDDSLHFTDTDRDEGDRSPGPFGQPEGAPPKAILTWINKTHPTMKKPQTLLIQMADRPSCTHFGLVPHACFRLDHQDGDPTRSAGEF